MISRRDKFAAMAMQGIITNYVFLDKLGIEGSTHDIELDELVASCALDFADALIAELDKTKKECEHDYAKANFGYAKICLNCGKDLKE